MQISHQFPKEIDVSDGGPYANYNWELFFHVPLTIAVHLSKNQRFAEAQRWFHYIFDPTCERHVRARAAAVLEVPRLPQASDGEADRRAAALAEHAGAECTPTELSCKTSILQGYEAITNKPFQPHAVARTRHLAYQYYVVMKYLDNLIAWGDSLFQQDTIETINEATQLYVLAANLLGPRPQRIPPRGDRAAEDLRRSSRQHGLDPMGNALVELEGQFPFNLGLPSAQRRRRRTPQRRCSASAARSTSASRTTTSCSATGTPSPTGCSRSATA